MTYREDGQQRSVISQRQRSGGEMKYLKIAASMATSAATYSGKQRRHGGRRKRLVQHINSMARINSVA